MRTITICGQPVRPTCTHCLRFSECKGKKAHPRYSSKYKYVERKCD